MAAALHQGVNPWFPARPDYWEFINIWDARWYGEVLQDGYPARLPVSAERQGPGECLGLLSAVSRSWDGLAGSDGDWARRGR